MKSIEDKDIKLTILEKYIDSIEYIDAEELADVYAKKETKANV